VSYEFARSHLNSVEVIKLPVCFIVILFSKSSWNNAWWYIVSCHRARLSSKLQTTTDGMTSCRWFVIAACCCVPCSLLITLVSQTVFVIQYIEQSCKC